MIETKTGETSFATGVQENQKTNGFGKELERKTKTRDWAIGKHGTLTNKQRNCNLVTQWTPSTKSWALQENKWTIALWVGPLINELIHALDYLVNSINENENQLIPREKHLVDDKCHEFIDRNMQLKIHSRN